MYRFIGILLLFLVYADCCCAASLTLDQCIERGMTLNPQVKSYRLAIDEADQGINEAWGAFLPTLSSSYTHSRLDNISDTGIDRDYLSQDTDSLQVRLSQPVFTGLGGVSGLKRARQSKQYREYEFLYMEQQVIREISTGFYDVLRARQLVKKWEESVIRLEDQQKIAAAWVEQEMAPQLRLLEVAVELSGARQSLVSAKTDRIEAQARLEEWLVLQPEEPFDIEGSFGVSGKVVCETMDSCLTQALSHYPTLQMAQLNIDIAHEDAKIIRARNLPQASLDAGWTDYEREYDSDLLNSEERDYYTFSFNVSFKPFQGGKNIFAFKKQQIKIQRLQYELSSQRNRVVTEVKTRFQQLKEGEGLLESAEQAVAEAAEAYKITARSTKLGLNSLDDLLNAELRLTQTEINKINAEHALQLARVFLDYVVGSQRIDSLVAESH